MQSECFGLLFGRGKGAGVPRRRACYVNSGIASWKWLTLNGLENTMDFSRVRRRGEVRAELIPGCHFGPLKGFGGNLGRLQEEIPISLVLEDLGQKPRLVPSCKQISELRRVPRYWVRPAAKR